MAFKMKGHSLPGPNKMKSPVKNRRVAKGDNGANLHNASFGNVYQHALAHGKTKAQALALLDASKKKKAPVTPVTPVIEGITESTQTKT